MKSGTIKPRFYPRRQILRRPILGDQRHLILIRSRTITPTDPFNVDFGESFVTVATVWAYIETKGGDTFFDGTNIVKSKDIHFVIRFISSLLRFKTDITQEYWIEYNGNRFDITTVESYDERQDWMKLVCNIRGDTTLPVNSA